MTPAPHPPNARALARRVHRAVPDGGTDGGTAVAVMGLRTLQRSARLAMAAERHTARR